MRVFTPVLFAVLFGFGFAPANASEPGGIANRHLSISVDKQSGMLTEIRDPNSGFNLIEVGPPVVPLWQLDLSASAVPVTSTNAQSFRCETMKDGGGGLRMVWGSFGPPYDDLQVEARVKLDPDMPASLWHIQWTGLDNRQVSKVRFPIVPAIRRQANERLAVPMWMGQLMDEPRAMLPGKQKAGQRHEWAYPGLLSIQCLAFYAQGGTGLYVAADDTSAYRKTLSITAKESGDLSCDVAHLPEISPAGGETWIMPYHVVLGTFQGDWMTAAERYRSWATNQVWAKESRLARRLVPEWILNTGLWVWNRGRSDQVLAPAVELQGRLNLPVSVFWHWWHGCSYDAGFPEYLPPREGTEPFIKAMANAHAHNVRALVYMNQRLWGLTTSSWTNENAERWAVKGLNGKIHPEVYNTFTKQACVSMCMGTEFWRKTYAGLAEDAICDLGVNGIYMDQACTSLACYDPNHPHPRGGGAYWIEGFRTMSQDIRQRVTSRDSRLRATGLAGEGCGEPWLPYLDLMLSLQVSKERYAAPDGWETIPFFHAVYHAYAVLYGNYSSLTMPPYDDLWPGEFAPGEPLKLLDQKFSRQFLMEQARAFVWGQQPTIANFLPDHLESRRVETEYVLNLAKLRRAANDYLLYGTYLRPPEINAPEAELDMSRLSIYAGQQGGLKSFQQRFPLVVAGAWRSPAGKTAIVLASYADDPVRLSFVVEPGYYQVPRGARVKLRDFNGSRDLGKLPPDSRLSFELSGRSACLIEFTR